VSLVSDLTKAVLFTVSWNNRLEGYIAKLPGFWLFKFWTWNQRK